MGDQCIILTAAHCVRSSDDGEWACNFAFYQGYKEGKAAQVITINQYPFVLNGLRLSNMHMIMRF